MPETEATSHDASCLLRRSSKMVIDRAHGLWLCLLPVWKCILLDACDRERSITDGRRSGRAFMKENPLNGLRLGMHASAVKLQA